MIYLQLFLEFFKTGLFAIGGGLATLPFLYDIADKYPWFTKDMLSDMLAVSESTPGPIGVNMATYAGFNASGILGGIVATFGLVLPSVIIIMFVAKILDKFSENKYVINAFYGLRPAVCALISVAALEVFKTSLLNVELFEKTKKLLDIINLDYLVLFILIFFINKKIKLHPIFIILLSAVCGIGLSLI